MGKNIKDLIWKVIFQLTLCFWASVPSFAQSRSAETLVGNLVAAQFENVRAIETDSATFVSIEDNLYRWNVDGIKAALGIIAISEAANKPLRFVLLKRGIPQIEIRGALAMASLEDTLMDNLTITYLTDNSWKVLKMVAPANPPENKIDLVLYPQFGLQNVLLSQIYEIQLNIAPAIEVSLWPGMLFTGQVIFPVVNQLGYEGDFIRPGFVTLTQEYRLPKQWFGRLTLGTFNANRYGADICVDHPLPNPRWSMGLNAGLTGNSHFYNGQWVTNNMNTFTWFVKTRYFNPKFDLQFDLSYGRYLNKDYGFRADCTRHFRETTVGFFAMYTGGNPNGGFHFSIPLPTAKRNRRHAFRLVPSRYFDWEYNAGTEFYYGRYYETRPNENRTEHWFNPIFIKNELLKTN